MTRPLVLDFEGQELLAQLRNMLKDIDCYSSEDSYRDGLNGAYTYLCEQQSFDCPCHVPNTVILFGDSKT